MPVRHADMLRVESLVRAVSSKHLPGRIAGHIGRFIITCAVHSYHHHTGVSFCCCLLQVCYYRDKQTTNKFQIAKVTKDGTSISEPFALETQWGYKAFEEPGAGAVGTW